IININVLDVIGVYLVNFNNWIDENHILF
ncbi:uncharacterized protein METZ01_LOCUS497116, partial [marine metagenome]